MKSVFIPKNWTERDLRMAEKAKTFEQLSRVGLRVAYRQYCRAVRRRGHKGLAIVFGAITNGGTLPPGEIRNNIRFFAQKIEELESLGFEVFDQRPFEEHLFRLKREAGKDHKPQDLLNGFYLPLFESGHFAFAFALWNWRKSHGARWERRTFRELAIQIFFTE